MARQSILFLVAALLFAISPWSLDSAAVEAEAQEGHQLGEVQGQERI